MAKDPDERWQTARDLMLELRWILEASDQREAPARVVDRRSVPAKFWILTALLLASVTIPFALTHFRTPSGELPAVRSYILPPENWSFSIASFRLIGSVAVSPDGRRLAFVAMSKDGKLMLWLRDLNSLTAQPLAGTESGLDPFWSPDSRSIGFFAFGKLKKIDASGRPPQTLCDAGLPRGASWNRDGMVLFASGLTGPIYRISASGGVPTPITNLDASRRETSHGNPYFLPDGRHFLYRAKSSAAERRTAVYVGSVDSEKPRLVLQGGSNAIYTPPGYLPAVHNGTLMGHPFDVNQLKLAGEPFPVADHVAFDISNRRSVFTASENGVLAYLGDTILGGSQLRWCDRSGNPGSIVGEETNYYRWPRISPDGKKVAVEVAESSTGNSHAWIYDLERSTRTRLTFEPFSEGNVCWSPHGEEVLFSSNRKGEFHHLYKKASNGVGNEELVVESEGQKYAHSWSADGRYIAYNRSKSKTDLDFDLWIAPLFGDRKPFPFLQTEFDGHLPAFSPDGRWLAYESRQSGKSEIYVASFPTPNTKLQVSTAGGSTPRWRRDGKELFYLALDNKMMAADIMRTDSTLKVGAVRPLFQVRAVREWDGSYDVSPDGQSFLINTIPEQALSTPITLVLKWTAGLKR